VDHVFFATECSPPDRSADRAEARTSSGWVAPISCVALARSPPIDLPRTIATNGGTTGDQNSHQAEKNGRSLCNPDNGFQPAHGWAPLHEGPPALKPLSSSKRRGSRPPAPLDAIGLYGEEVRFDGHGKSVSVTPPSLSCIHLLRQGRPWQAEAQGFPSHSA